MVVDIFKGILAIPVPFNMIVLICLFFAVTGLVTGIAREIRKFGCHRQDIDFKRELVDRGLSSEEIERIVMAQPVEANTPVTVGGNYYAGGAPAAPART
ncbi:MAG: hypothetical protein AB7G28_01935 [Pirellulales bacterium]